MQTAEQPLEIGSDLAIRNRYFVKASFAHPAKLHLALYEWILQKYTLPGDTIADPMAGIGSCLLAAAWQRNVIAREVEPRWLALAHENAAVILRESGLFAGAMNIEAGDAREPWGFECDHAIFSPPYGCSFSTTKTAKGTLPHRLRRLRDTVPYSQLWEQAIKSEAVGAPGYLMSFYGEAAEQVGHLRGAAYWEAMAAIYAQAFASVRAAGRMAIVIKDHIRDGKRVTVADDTVSLCERVGFVFEARHKRLVYPLSLWQRRRKEQGQPIVQDEDILIFRKR